nr:SMI1/KNR4 family protein [Mameliella alba]
MDHVLEEISMARIIFGNSVTQDRELASEENVLDLENELGLRLPDDYREYLLSVNGGQFERCRFIMGREFSEYSVYDVEEMLSLGHGECPLEQVFQVNNYYGLDLKPKDAREFIVIGFVSGGNLLILNLKSGAVMLFDHDIAERPRRCYFEEVSSGFAEFVDGLVEKTKENSRIGSNLSDKEFEDLLAQFKLQREEEERRMLKGGDLND